MNFYRLESELQSLLSSIEEGGEISEELLQKFDCLSSNDIPKAVDNLSTLIRETGLVADVLKAEAKYFSTRAAYQLSAQDKFKKHLLTILNIAKVKKVSTNLYTVSVVASQPKVVPPEGFKVEDLLGTPFARFVRSTHELNKEEVKEAFKIGMPVPGGVKLEEAEHTRIHLR